MCILAPWDENEKCTRLNKNPSHVEEALHTMCEEGFCSSFTPESLMFPINSPSADEGVTEEKEQLQNKLSQWKKELGGKRKDCSYKKIKYKAYFSIHIPLLSI